MSTKADSRLKAPKRLAKMHRTSEGYATTIPKLNAVSTKTIVLESIGTAVFALLLVLWAAFMLSAQPVVTY